MDTHALGNRYEMGERLGTGGMASVYLARDTFLGRNVAIKILHEPYAADPTFIARFRREAQAAARLSHPNVVAVYDWGEAPALHAGGDARYFLVMEYVPGPNLKDILRSRGALPETEALDIAAQVALALDAAHQQGLVHRDVKPHNVLLDPMGRAKVTDFGIAHAAGVPQLTAPDVVSGTAQYLSPEQAQRGQLDGRSDIYSLGIMLYEMLTGRLPFEGDSMVEIAMQHLRESPRPPRLDHPEISAVTEAIVLRALAKDPARRYPSAAAMHDALVAARVTAPVAVQADADTTALGSFVQADLTQEIPRRGTARLGTLPVHPRPRVRRSQPPRLAPWMALPFLLLLFIIGGAAMHVFAGGGSSHHQAGPVVAAPHPTVTPSRVRSRPKPTSAPAPTATPRPRASATSPPVPTSTQVRATATPAAATPTSIPPTAGPTAEVAAVSPAGGDPAATVTRFYSLVAAHRFRAAAALWSPSMQSRFDSYSNINLRFSPDTRIDLRKVNVVSRSSGQATVEVAMTEFRADGTSDLTGSWTLVPGPNGEWLMDAPHF